MDHNEEEYLSLSKAAELLGVSTKTIRNWDDKGKIRTVRTPGNHRRIPISEVTRLLQEEKLRPEETLAELQQESEAYMGKADAKPAYPIPTGFSHLGVGDKNPPKIPKPEVKITPSEYKAHLKLFGLEDIEALNLEKTELGLVPDLNLMGELNRDEVTHFTRLLVHKIEDVLNSRLTDNEFISFSNMVANIHEKSQTDNSVKEKSNDTVRPGRATGIAPGKYSGSHGPGLGYLGD